MLAGLLGLSAAYLMWWVYFGGLAAGVTVLAVMLYLEDRARGLRWGDRTAWDTPTTA